MASSASGQDEPNRALGLATRAGKMEPSCPLGTTCCIPQAKFHQKPYNRSFIDQVCLVKMAGYWPRSFFACLWTSTPSRSINTQKKNEANIQPSWPHTWSITHTYNPSCEWQINWRRPMYSFSLERRRFGYDFWEYDINLRRYFGNIIILVLRCFVPQ